MKYEKRTQNKISYNITFSKNLIFVAKKNSFFGDC